MPKTEQKAAHRPLSVGRRLIEKVTVYEDSFDVGFKPGVVDKKIKSVDDKQFGTLFRMRAMRIYVFRDLIAGSGNKSKFPPIIQFCY